MKAQYGIYVTDKDENGEHRVELIEGPMPRTVAAKKAKELQKQEVTDSGYTGSGPLPSGFRSFWAMNTISGKIIF